MLLVPTHGKSGTLSVPCRLVELGLADEVDFSPGIHQAEIDLETGQVGEWEVIWEGTGGEVSCSLQPGQKLGLMG